MNNIDKIIKDLIEQGLSEEQISEIIEEEETKVEKKNKQKPKKMKKTWDGNV